jgi:uncharacterized membrane protein
MYLFYRPRKAEDGNACYTLLGLNDTKARLQYLDWLRGLAVVLMIQVHATNSFLDPKFRNTLWWDLSQFLGGLAAPLFLFTAGISMALVFDRLVDRGASSSELLIRTVRRSGWIFLLAYAFRVEQVLTWFPYGNWQDVWKIDILNCIAASSLIAGFAAAFVTDDKNNAAVLACASAATILMAPLIAPVRGLPTLLLAYLNGNGHLEYFTFFPWAAYTFAGMAAGYLLIESRKLGQEYQFMLWSAVAGIVLFFMGRAVNRDLGLMLGLASYSRSSPHYVFQKMGYVLVLLYAAYRWPLKGRALLVFGQTSLLVYWLHIEFVYGRLRMFRNSLNVQATAAQLLWLIPLMLGIAFMWRRRKEKVKTRLAS